MSMSKSELIGYIRKSKAGDSLKICVLKTILEKAETVQSMDGTTEYLTLVMGLSRLKKVVAGEMDVTSVCHLSDDEPAGNLPLREYMIITTDGHTFSPRNDGPEPDIENCQVLGRLFATGPKEAVKLMLQNNPELIEMGFEDVIVYPISDEATFCCISDCK